MIKVIHLLASNKFSGAENVVCQIIKMFEGSCEMFYCSPKGPIENSLNDKGVKYIPINNLSKKELKKIYDEYKPDIIHAHDVRASVVASSLSKKCKIISHIHGNDEKNMGKITLKSLLYALSIKKFSKIFWVSKSCLEKYYFKKLVKNRSEVLYNIIDVEDLLNQANKDENTYDYDICFLGRLTEIKNPIRALEIMKDVVLRNKDVKCAVIGDGNMFEDCDHFIKENNLSENIKLFGFMKNPHKILSNSKLLLMSSINEGTPMVLLEAFALGVPLVSTPIDGAVEIIKDEKMGCLYNSNEEAVDYILKILSRDNREVKNYLQKFSNDYNDKELYKAKILNAYNKELL